MKYGSVCSGVEAASLAWKGLGWTPAFFSEVEPFPCGVLCYRLNATKPLRPLLPDDSLDDKERKTRASWLNQLKDLPEGGTVPNLGDFTLIKKGDYNGKIDLLVGGTPCQDLSIAGKRMGFDGKRSVLALDFVRLCFETGTRWIAWENVPATLSSHDGRDFATFLSLLCGWDIPVPGDGWRKSGIVTGAPGYFGVSWRVLDAQYTRVSQFPRAIPQRRKRLFLIGYLGNWKYPAQVLFDGEMRGGNTPPCRTKKQGAAPSFESCTGETGSKDVISLIPYGMRLGAHQDGVASTITRIDAKFPQCVCREAKWWDGNDQAGTLTVTSDRQLMPDKGRLQCVVEQQPEMLGCLDMRQIENHDKGVAPTLIATDYKGGKAVCFQQNSRDEVRLMSQDGSVAGTLVAEPGAKQQNYLCYENHAQDSRIKPVEVSQAITARMGTGGGNLPVVQEMEGDEKAAVKDVCPTLEANLFNKNTFQDCEKFIVENPVTASEEGCENEAQREDGELSDDGAVIGFIKNDAGGVQQGFWKNVFPTLRAAITPAITWNECFHLSFCDANGTRKDRKNGGLYITKAETSQTVTTKGPHTDTIVIALDGDKMAKAERKGGSGFGINEDGAMYTQTVKDVHAVAYEEPVGIDLFNGKETGDVAATVSANSCATSTRNGPSVVECVPLDLRNATRDPEKHDEVNRQGVGVGEDGAPMNTVTAASVPGVGWQATVRRLLPVECERLMGFPDNWTRIPWKGKPEEECPDAPRYKACGNSMCVNVMAWIGERIDEVEKEISAEASREASVNNNNGGVDE